jgi:hypothetical protein
MHLSPVPVSVFAIAEAVGSAAVDIASVQASVFGSDVCAGGSLLEISFRELRT